MNVILIKIFATALAFSQVTARPDAVKTEFDPVTDRAEVAQLLSAGCAHMRKSFDIEEINLDDLIATAMEDKDALGGEIKALKGLSITDLYAAYRQFCKNERVENSPVDLGAVIAFYNDAMKDLPDVARLKGMKLPGMSQILDNKGERFAELFTPGQQAGLVAARGDPATCAQRLRRRRGQALLPASRNRRARAGARLHRQSGAARPAARRLDHHPAGGEKPAGRERRHL